MNKINAIGKVASMIAVCMCLWNGDVEYAIMFGVIALLFDTGIDK